jgi:hypothetical protein
MVAGERDPIVPREQTACYIPRLSRTEQRVIHLIWHEYDCQVKNNDYNRRRSVLNIDEQKK